MSVLTVAAVTSIVATGANMVAGRKRAKAQAKAAQEAAYIEGAAPVIPVANELAIDTIGDAETPETAAPDFREALEGTYGGGMYDTQDFQSGQQQQIPPELEALLMQQQSTGMEPTNVQFARSGGPVGLPQDVYHFSAPKISQMQMDVDPGVRNVGNAMRAQMEANPGMGMVSASAADIDQMATGGPVQPRGYADGDPVQRLSVVDLGDGLYDELRVGSDNLRELTYSRPLTEAEGGWSREAIRELEEEQDRIGELYMSYLYAGKEVPKEVQDLYDGGRELPPVKIETRSSYIDSSVPMSDAEKAEYFKKLQPQRYDDGGVVREAVVDTVTNQIPGVSQAKILRAIEMTDDPEEKRRLARQLIPGVGLAEMGLGGLRKIGSRIRERRANRREEAPVLGPQMRNEGGSVRPKKYQEGSEGGIRELYKKIPTNLRLFGEYLAGVESPITEKDFTEDELDVIRNQIIAQKINNEVLEDEYRKAGDADAVETFEKTRGRTSVSPYDIQDAGLPTFKTTFGRRYFSGGEGLVDKGWEESLKALDDPNYMVATTLGKYTAEDVDDGFRIREDYDFNRGASDRPSPIQDIESFDQLKNLLINMQATPEVLGETLANMIRSEPRAVDIRL